MNECRMEGDKHGGLYCVAHRRVATDCYEVALWEIAVEVEQARVSHRRDSPAVALDQIRRVVARTMGERAEAQNSNKAEPK